MTSRTEQHHRMAQERIRALQETTTALIEGRAAPDLPVHDVAASLTFFTPQMGEMVIDGSHVGSPDTALSEYRMWWKRIPDMRIVDFEVFASETGWAQLLRFAGTGQNGKEYRAQEVDIIKTDSDCKVTRFEIYSDGTQWGEIAAYCNDREIGDFAPGEYMEIVAES